MQIALYFISTLKILNIVNDIIWICLFQAYVLLKRNPDFDNIHITSWWTSAYSADVARFVKVIKEEIHNYYSVL